MYWIFILYCMNYTGEKCCIICALLCWSDEKQRRSPSRRWHHQPVGAGGAARVHHRQRALGRRDGACSGLRGQASGHPPQPGVLRAPQGGALRSPVGHHVQGPPLHQGRQTLGGSDFTGLGFFTVESEEWMERWGRAAAQRG